MEAHENLNEQVPCRYIVGIDLGTTNSAVCWIDTEQLPWRVELFPIPQLVAPGQVEARDTLPSFHFQPLNNEMGGQVLRLPWQKHPLDYVVGVIAREGPKVFQMTLITLTLRISIVA